MALLSLGIVTNIAVVKPAHQLSLLVKRQFSQATMPPWLPLGGIVLVALLLRVLMLDARPPHFDEGINGWFVDQIWGRGVYDYDPENFHGPLYFYLLLLAELVLGRDIVSFRLITALISTGIVLMVALHARWFGRAALWAAAALAVSPGMVFYGRDAIHESLFTLSLALFLYGLIRWQTEGGRLAVQCMAAGMVISLATKETFVIFYGTLAIALAIVAVLTWLLPRQMQPERLKPDIDREAVSLSYIAKVIALSTGILFFLYSDLFTNIAGIKDLGVAIANWFGTGTGAESGHEKPFHYWLQLLLEYEWPFLLCLLALPVLFWHNSLWSWRLGTAAFGMLLAHSLIPYKTPWLVVSVFFLLAFVFGFIVDLLLSKPKQSHRPLVTALACLALSLAFIKSVHLNFVDHTELTEPYVYVHTSSDVNELMRAIESLVSTTPHERNMRISLAAPDPWPLPWLLGRYPGLSYTADYSADIIITPLATASDVEAALPLPYIRQEFQLRAEQQTRWIYYRQDKFEAFVFPQDSIVGRYSEASTR